MSQYLKYNPDGESPQQVHVVVCSFVLSVQFLFLKEGSTDTGLCFILSSIFLCNIIMGNLLQLKSTSIVILSIIIAIVIPYEIYAECFGQNIRLLHSPSKLLFSLTNLCPTYGFC